MYNTLSEFTVFWGCLYGGLCIGIAYEFFALLSLPFRRWHMRGFFDLLFYGAALCIAALFLLYLNGGRLRLYALMAFAGGALLYRYTAGALFRGLGRRILHIFSHFWPCTGRKHAP